MKKLMTITLATLSLSSFAQNNKTICGDTDDRVLSYENEIGRVSKMNELVGCTATLISPTCAITAGHCVSVLEKVSFNVPETRNNIPQAANVRDEYRVIKESIVYTDNGEGDDWAVFKLKQNHITKDFPGDIQGYLNVVLDKNKVRKGATVRVTGYGVDRNDPIRDLSQQTHTGKIEKIGGFFSKKSRLGYSVDTMGGNSGSSIVLENTNEVIGVHAIGTCGTWHNYNVGTLIATHPKFKAAVEACLK